jgi:hypothetical protein
MLVKDGYKGSGDYGVHLSIQWTNLNRTEGNRNLHVVTRGYPFVSRSDHEPGFKHIQVNGQRNWCNCKTNNILLIRE